MLLALITTQLARQRTGLEGGARHGGVKGGLAGEDPPGRQADICAVEAEADATDHRLHLLLAQVGVGVGTARLGAVEACLNALREHLWIYGWLAGVGFSQQIGRASCR